MKWLYPIGVLVYAVWWFSEHGLVGSPFHLLAFVLFGCLLAWAVVKASR